MYTCDFTHWMYYDFKSNDIHNMICFEIIKWKFICHLIMIKLYLNEDCNIYHEILQLSLVACSSVKEKFNVLRWDIYMLYFIKAYNTRLRANVIDNCNLIELLRIWKHWIYVISNTNGVSIQKIIYFSYSKYV